MQDKSEPPTMPADLLHIVEKPKPEFVVAAKTVASIRHPTKNEDTLLQSTNTRTFGVFDGLGGLKGGDVASQLGQKTVDASISSLSDKMSVEQATDVLVTGVLNARDAVFNADPEPDLLKKMGSTATLAHLWQGDENQKKLIVVNVGDSRAYLNRKGHVTKITLDDSKMRNLIDNETLVRQLEDKFDTVVDPDNELTDDEMELFRIRNQMTQDLGSAAITPRVNVVDLQEGDEVLLCSDGVPDNLLATEIESAWNNGSTPDESVDKLVVAAFARTNEFGHKRSKPDDISAIVIRVGQEDKKNEPDLSTSRQPAPVKEDTA